MSLHLSVLMDEVLEGLDLNPGDTIVDGTINGGGHAVAIAAQLGLSGHLIGIDQDHYGLEVSKGRLANVGPRIDLEHDNTHNLDRILDDLEIDLVDGILLDLGWSSNQFETPERGFSFRHEGPLLMTLSDDPTKAAFTAHEIVNQWSEESLVDILVGYGEERFAKRIAKTIVEVREQHPIETTTQLADLIASAIPNRFRKKGIHPATQTFQAIRIAANDEMGALKDILKKGFERLAPGGRMVVISFHSVEDRIVKQAFRGHQESGRAEVLTKRPITAGDTELAENPRARSAKLRILRKL